MHGMTPRRPCIVLDGKERETRPVAAPTIYPIAVWWPLVNLTISFTLEIEMLCNGLVRTARLLLFVLLSFRIQPTTYVNYDISNLICQYGLQNVFQYEIFISKFH